MATEHDPQAGENGAETPAPDFLPLRLIDLFIKPDRLMTHAGRRPCWWQAGLLILLINGVAMTWVTPIMVREVTNHLAQSTLPGGVAGEQILETLAGTTEKIEASKLSAILGNGLQTWAMCIVFAFVLYFFVRLAEGQGRLPQALGIVHWAALIPYGVGTLVKLPIILQTGRYEATTLSAAAFLPDEAVGGTLFNFLAYFTDVTQWWGLALLVIGFGRVFGLARRPAILSVLLPWALATAVQAAFRSIFGF